MVYSIYPDATVFLFGVLSGVAFSAVGRALLERVKGTKDYPNGD